MSKQQEYYLLTQTRADSADNCITFYGPYNSYEECLNDGNNWEYENNGNALWQIVRGPLDIKLRQQFARYSHL